MRLLPARPFFRDSQHQHQRSAVIYYNGRIGDPSHRSELGNEADPKASHCAMGRGRFANGLDQAHQWLLAEQHGQVTLLLGRPGLAGQHTRPPVA